MKQIIKVNASAGSGKTYQLAKRYVELLLAPEYYDESVYTRGIVAITFTKKATVEMKSRILLFLKKIALNSFSNTYERDDLMSIGAQDGATLRKRALRVLSYILNQYDFFKVQTIDSLVREMLTSSVFKADRSSVYRIAEDYREYLEYGVDALLEQSLDTPSLQKLFARFLQNYIYVKEDPAWVPKKDIAAYIETLFRLTNQYGCVLKPSAYDVRAIPEVKGKIRAIVDSLAEAHIEGTNATFSKTLKNLVTKKKITADAFKKTFQKEKYPVNKGFNVPDSIQSYWNDLRFLITELCEIEAHSLYDPYISIYKEVHARSEEYARKNDIVFLEELNARIKRILSESTFSIPELCARVAPFVRHFLIDEFQDTNLINWQNVEPLVSEALSNGGTLFYVGDKKQAIYQFRGGDARLFDLVPQFLSHYILEERTLNTNYRSHAEIVNFTKTIFSAENLLRTIQSIDENEKDDGLGLDVSDYEEVVSAFREGSQKPRPNHEHGYVRLERVPGKTSEESEDLIMDTLHALIHDAQERGFSFSDIAILTRSNSELEKITGVLIAKGLPIVSEKTLNIRTNRFINELLAFLRFLESPIDNMSFALFVHSDVFMRASGIQAKKIESFLFRARFSVQREKNTYFYMLFRSEFPHEWKVYIEPFFKKVGIMPLYEFIRQMCETLSIFRLIPDAHAFFMRFLELVKEKESEYPSISGFLEFFDGLQETDNALYVPFADTGDSLQLLTYHKAKGLEFPIVIIPFLSMTIKADKQVCCNDEKDKEGEMRLIHVLKSYVPWSDNLSQHYRTALKQALMAEFNTLYVALTRPVCELYACVPEHVNGNHVNRAKYLFSDEVIEFGVRLNKNAYFENARRSREPVETLLPSNYVFWMDKLNEKFTDISQIMNRKNILRGKVLHHMLSFIGNIASCDLSELLKEAEIKARLMFPHVHNISDYTEEIRALVDQSDLSEIFSVIDGAVFTEKDIVTSNGRIKRLDRLIVQSTEVTVIDYKSAQYGLLGEESNDSLHNPYKVQVAEYVMILKELYPKHTIKGYLLYLNSKKLEPVTL